jgi:hypothetical protein
MRTDAPLSFAHTFPPCHHQVVLLRNILFFLAQSFNFGFHAVAERNDASFDPRRGLYEKSAV